MLRQDQRVRLRFLHRLPEIPPELMVEGFAVSQVGRHIETPPVHIVWRRHPFFPDPHDIIIQLPGALIIQLRQGLISPPAVIMIIVRPLAARKPEILPVRTVLRNIGALFIALLLLVDLLSVHPFIEGPAVIEHPVQDHPHSLRVDRLHHLGKKGIARLQVDPVRHPGNIGPGVPVRLPGCHSLLRIVDDPAEMGIDIIIILNVIFMIGRRNKKRVEVDHFHAKTFDIVQLVKNPLQIAAVKIIDIQRIRILVPVFHMMDRLFIHINIFSVLYIVYRISVPESVHKDLIHHRALGPVRRLKSGGDPERCVPAGAVRRSRFCIPADFSAFFYPEAVPIPLCCHPDPDPEKIKSVLRRLFRGRLQLKLSFSETVFFHQKYGVGIPLRRPESEQDLISRVRFGRTPVILCLITEKSPFVYPIHMAHTSTPYLPYSISKLHLSLYHSIPNPGFIQVKRTAFCAVLFRRRYFFLMGCSKTI